MQFVYEQHHKFSDKRRIAYFRVRVDMDGTVHRFPRIGSEGGVLTTFGVLQVLAPKLTGDKL